MTRKKLTLERRYRATREEVWALWTTKDGIESWWGPEGFRVEVRQLELKVGGALRYAMIAHGAQQVDFMKRAGRPLESETTARFTELVPCSALGWDTVVDFVPGVAKYTSGMRVTFEQRGDLVHLAVELDVMHDETWTKRAVMGWEQQFLKLDKVLAT